MWTSASSNSTIFNIDQEVTLQILGHVIRAEGDMSPNDIHPNEACLHNRIAQEAEPSESSNRLLVESDMLKVFYFPEPRRVAQWTRMSFVACNGTYFEFEGFYKNYCIMFDPSVAKIETKSPAASLDGPSQESQRQADQEGQQQSQRLEEGNVQHQTAKEYLQGDKVEQQSARYASAPLVTRSKCLRVLSNTIHGIRVYSPKGRVLSWSDGDDSRISEFLILGICSRKEPLTFASANREGNRRQLQ